MTKINAGIVSHFALPKITSRIPTSTHSNARGARNHQPAKIATNTIATTCSTRKAMSKPTITLCQLIGLRVRVRAALGFARSITKNATNKTAGMSANRLFTGVSIIAKTTNTQMTRPIQATLFLSFIERTPFFYIKKFF